MLCADIRCSTTYFSAFDLGIRQMNSAVSLQTYVQSGAETDVVVAVIGGGVVAASGAANNLVAVAEAAAPKGEIRIGAILAWAAHPPTIRV